MFKWFSKKKKEQIILEPPTPFQTIIREVRGPFVALELENIDGIEAINDHHFRVQKGIIQYNFWRNIDFPFCCGVSGHLNDGVNETVEIFYNSEIKIDGPWIEQATKDLNQIYNCAADLKSKRISERTAKEEKKKQSIDNYRKMFDEKIH